MTDRPNASYDPTELAKSVRDLASAAHRALNDPGTPASELRALAELAADLRDQLQDGPLPELARWLESARQQLEIGNR